MNKYLHRTALLSSPILALYGISPFYIFNQVDVSFFLTTFFALSCLIFLFWLVNMLILTKFQHPKSWERYAFSYAFVFLTQLIFTFIGENFGTHPPGLNLIYPILTTFAVNTIILILSNSILLRFQKESADIEIQRLKISALEAQKQMLAQQLQPHFLFNALHTLKSLIGENPSGAEDYTVKLSEFLRYSIQAQAKEAVSLEEELKFTQDYINLQKGRFGEAMRVRIDIPSEFLKRKIPAYALQTLVENAVKHNAFTEKKPVFISIEIEGDRVKVSNNKAPRRAEAPSGTGLQNLNRRYRLIAHSGIEIAESEAEFVVYLRLF